MRAYATQCIKTVKLLHVPKPGVLFPHHQGVAQKLFNRKDALLRALGGQASASFFGTRHLKPQSSRATFGITFQPRHGLHSVVLVHIGKDINRSMANTFFPDKKDLPLQRQQFVEAWSKWCKANDMPGPPLKLPLRLQQAFDPFLATAQP